jgi:hypothetical protein
MPKYRDDRGTFDLQTDRAWAKLAGGRNAEGLAQLDFGRAAIHLTSPSEIGNGTVRSITWRGPNGFHALFATALGASDQQAADLAERFSAELVRGFFDIPRSGAVQHTGPLVKLLAPPEPSPDSRRRAPPPPAETLASLLAAVASAERRLAPVVADLQARKQRLDRATDELKIARAAFIKAESVGTAQHMETAERELRLATLIEAAKPDAGPFEDKLAAAREKVRTVLSSRPALLAPYFDGAQFTQATTFDSIARSYYASGTSWLSRSPKEQGHAMFAFDVGASTRLELHQRFRFRCVAHSIAEGWRITAPLGRAVTEAELRAIAAHLNARAFYVQGSTPASGSARIVEIDEWGPLDVEAVLKAQAEALKTNEPVATSQQTDAAS